MGEKWRGAEGAVGGVGGGEGSGGDGRWEEKGCVCYQRGC